jgi:hypothetical protein
MESNDKHDQEIQIAFTQEAKAIKEGVKDLLCFLSMQSSLQNEHKVSR